MCQACLEIDSHQQWCGYNWGLHWTGVCFSIKTIHAGTESAQIQDVQIKNLQYSITKKNRTPLQTE